MFWGSLVIGNVRVSLPHIVDYLAEAGWSKESILIELASELHHGNMVLLIAAKCGLLATEWRQKDWRTRKLAVELMQEALAGQAVELLFSPVLKEPPESFLEYFLEYFKREQLNTTVTHLRHACRSVFALDIPPFAWKDLAKKKGFRCSRVWICLRCTMFAQLLQVPLC